MEDKFLESQLPTEHPCTDVHAAGDQFPFSRLFSFHGIYLKSILMIYLHGDSKCNVQIIH